MSIYMLANPLSILISFVLGGWLATRYGWRLTFFLMGLPALLLATVVKLTVRDPRRSKEKDLRTVARLPRLGRVLVGFLARQATRHLTLAIILLLTMGAGLGPWYAHFSRYHGLSTFRAWDSGSG